MTTEQPNLLCLATYFKGEPFLREAAAQGANVYLLTLEKLLGRAWPRDSLAEVYGLPNEATREETIRAVSYLAKKIQFDSIVALDDFDVETGAALREHLRIPGMGDTTARYFRDKLAMRQKALDEGILVPDFVHALNDESMKNFMARRPPPWMHKPRSEASAAGITKVENENQLWDLVRPLGDRQSHFLLEEYLPGDVFHVDSIVTEHEVVFAEVHQCLAPPFDVAHHGGIFATRTVKRGSPDHVELTALNERVLRTMNLVRGVSHVEYIKGKNDGRFYMLECASRVGGAHIADMIEASTGLNLWAEWAKLEVGQVRKAPYRLPQARADYAGLVVTLAREEHPDLSAFSDPEVVYRSPEAHHIGLAFRSPSHERIEQLIAQYTDRLRALSASLPALDKPTH